ncbi:MAG: DUF4124 domain-containing protein [Proteobacteria bacterium]|nr:DUF4124 domain-containing protein [Pseudomonadota bacterium]
MGNRAIFLIIGLLAASAALSEAYRWVDENGIVHYSDRPEPGAELIILPEYSASRQARRYQRPTATSRPTQSNQTSPAAALFRYERVEITSPGAEETLWNIEGILNVSVTVTPALKAGHQVRAYFNGNGEIVAGTSFQIEEVYRGVHNLQVEIIDENGKLMIRSRANRFYVQQNKVNF